MIPQQLMDKIAKTYTDATGGYTSIGCQVYAAHVGALLDEREELLKGQKPQPSADADLKVALEAAEADNERLYKERQVLINRVKELEQAVASYMVKENQETGQYDAKPKGPRKKKEPPKLDAHEEARMYHGKLSR